MIELDYNCNVFYLIRSLVLICRSVPSCGPVPHRHSWLWRPWTRPLQLHRRIFLHLLLLTGIHGRWTKMSGWVTSSLCQLSLPLYTRHTFIYKTRRMHTILCETVLIDSNEFHMRFHMRFYFFQQIFGHYLLIKLPDWLIDFA